MPSILQLPEEVLHIIFNDDWFDYDDLRDFQYVCRAWYRPAHMLMMEEISLYGSGDIERFIASIDCNPDPAYLRAVRKIDIDGNISNDLPPEQYRLSKENINKLICRFPNLHTITVFGDLVVLENFDEKICETILKACPRLESFIVYRKFDDIRTENKIMNKIRLLLTELEIRKSEVAQGFENLQEYMTNFPRLRHVGDYTTTIDSFQKLLPIFEKLPLLKQLAIYAKGHEDIAYNDKYVEEHPLAKKTLSNITELNLLTCSLNANAFDFIKKYLTGLLELTVKIDSQNTWQAADKSNFRNNTLDLIPFAKNVAKFHFQIHLDSLADCLPDIVRKVFRQVPQPYTNVAKRDFHIGLNNSSRVFPSEKAVMDLAAWKSRRSIKIVFEDKLSLEDITDVLSESERILDTDNFTLEIKERGKLSGYGCETTMEMYDDLFELVPTVKEMCLDIPLSFKETKVTPDKYNVLAKVEDVVLNATADARFQTLLGGFFYSFPNIKRLSFNYFTGIWRSDMGEFQLDLPKYDLACLTLDVTPVIVKMKDVIEKKWFILEVEFLSNSEWSMYRVSIEDLSFTKLSSSRDLYGLTRSKDYYRVHVTIYNLNTLKIRKSILNYQTEDYSPYCMSDGVMIFPEKL